MDENSQLEMASSCCICHFDLADSKWVLMKCCSIAVHYRCLVPLAQNGKANVLSRQTDRKKFPCHGCSTITSLKSGLKSPHPHHINLINAVSKVVKKNEMVELESELEQIIQDMEDMDQN